MKPINNILVKYPINPKILRNKFLNYNNQTEYIYSSKNLTFPIDVFFQKDKLITKDFKSKDLVFGTLVNNIKHQLKNILSDNKIRDISNEDFELTKIFLDETLKSSKDYEDINTYYDYVKNKTLNRYNIQLINKIISDKKLYKNENLIKYLNSFIPNTMNKEVAQNKLCVLNKFIKDDDLYNNPEYVKHLGLILNNLNDAKSPESNFMLRFLENEDLYKNSNLDKYIFRLLSVCNDIKEYQGNFNNYSQFTILDKIVNNKTLINNKKFMSSLPKTFGLIFFESASSYKLLLLEKFIGDQRIYENAEIFDNLQNLIEKILKKQHAETKITILDKYLELQSLNKDEKLKLYINELLGKAENNNEKDIALRILNNDRFNNDEDILSSLTQSMGNLYLPAQVQIYNRFLDDEKYYNSSILLKDLPNLLNFPKEKIKDGSVYKFLFDNKELETFLQFQKNAIYNKNLLQTGFQYLSNDDVLNLTSSYHAIRAFNILGKKNLESTFSLTAVGFKEACKDVALAKLSDDNLELLLQKINPKKSVKYNLLGFEITQLKQLLKQSRDEKSLKEISDLKAKKTQLEEKQKYLTNECKRKSDKNDELREEYKIIQKELKQIKYNIGSYYWQNKNSDKIRKIITAIDNKTTEQNNMLEFISKLSPQEIISKLKVISAIGKISDDKSVKEFINMIDVNTIENEQKWNQQIHSKIFDRLHLKLDEMVIKKLDLLHSRYLSQMLSSSTLFFVNMQKLVKIIDNYPDKEISYILDSLPQNMKVKEKFEEVGIDYDRWTKLDTNSKKVKVVYIDPVVLQKKAILHLEEDFNSEMYNLLPDEIKNNIEHVLKEHGFEFTQKSFNMDRILIKPDNISTEDYIKNTKLNYLSLTKSGKTLTSQDLLPLMSILKKTINSDEFWTTVNCNKNVDNARKNMYNTFMKIRKDEIQNALRQKQDNLTKLELRKTNMYDIKNALSIGNDAQCCTGLGQCFKEYTAPIYIMNKFIGAIELVDNNKSVGNTMIYLAKVNNELSLILDDIELKTAYRYNDTVRDLFIDYAQDLCKELGKPQMKIYAGPNRHKLNMSVFPKEKCSMQIIGVSGDDKVYLDYDSSDHILDGNEISEIELYKIK